MMNETVQGCLIGFSLAMMSVWIVYAWCAIKNLLSNLMSRRISPALGVFDQWMFERIVHRNIVQGYDYKLDEMFKIIRAEAEATYTEDNMVTLDSYMHDHFEKSQRTTWSQPCQECRNRQPIGIKGQFDQTDAWAPAFGGEASSHVELD